MSMAMPLCCRHEHSKKFGLRNRTARRLKRRASGAGWCNGESAKLQPYCTVTWMVWLTCVPEEFCATKSRRYAPAGSVTVPIMVGLSRTVRTFVPLAHSSKRYTPPLTFACACTENDWLTVDPSCGEQTLTPGLLGV